jgi:hypothetical protein
VYENPDIMFPIVKARQDELVQRAEARRRVAELKGGNRGLSARVDSWLGSLLAARRVRLQARCSHACPKQKESEALT